MKVTVKMTGAQAFAGQFKILDLAAATRLGKVVESSTAAVERGAKARAPQGTGELLGSIRSKVSPDKFRGTVMAGFGELPRKGSGGRRTKSGAKAKLGKGAYAPVVEFGSHAPVRQAKPFMFPAAEAERSHFFAETNKALNMAVADTEKRA